MPQFPDVLQLSIGMLLIMLSFLLKCIYLLQTKIQNIFSQSSNGLIIQCNNLVTVSITVNDDMIAFINCSYLPTVASYIAI